MERNEIVELPRSWYMKNVLLITETGWIFQLMILFSAYLAGGNFWPDHIKPAKIKLTETSDSTNQMQVCLLKLSIFIKIE